MKRIGRWSESEALLNRRSKHETTQAPCRYIDSYLLRLGIEKIHTSEGLSKKEDPLRQRR